MSEGNAVIKFEEGRSSILSILKRFLKNIATVSTIYFFGYFDLSIAWLIAPVLLNVFRHEWKKTSDRKRQAVKLSVQDEKRVILAQLGDLPSWVYFPDIERAEWVNRMLVQLWPNVNTYMIDMIKTTIEPKIQETLTLYKMNGFAFDKLRFGTIPPRIGGIKVYDKHISRTEIMMDVDLIYAGDCDISFYLKGLSGGIKDFQIHGMMRLIMKPLIPVIPFVGAVQVFFLNKPTVDFNLVGAADVLDIPGVSDILRKVIIDQIAAMMVLPNKLPIVLSETVPSKEVKTPDPEGVLRVQVVQAIKLMKKDIGVLGKGKSDPYIIVTMGAQEYRSKTIDNTVNPKWDFWCEAVVTFPCFEQLNFQVWDWDPGLPGKDNDDFLGRASLKLNDVLNVGEIDTWVSLEEVKHGMVHLRLMWYQLTSNIDDLKPAIDELDKLRVPGISSSILILYIDSIQNLPDARANKRPDPIVSITAGHETHGTGVQFRTSSPVYEQGFTFLIHNPRTDSFTLKVIDQKTGQELGSLVYPLNCLLTKTNLKQEVEPFGLKGCGQNTKILFSAQLKILKKSPKKDVPNFVFSSTIPNVSPPSTPNSVTTTTEVTETNKSTDKDFKDDILDKNDDSTGNDVKSVTSSVIEEEVNWESYKPEEVSNSCQWINDQLDSKSTGRVGSLKGSLRRRNTSQSETKKLGSIEVTLNYVPERQRLILIIHRIVDLPIKDPTDLPDPYVKVYLLPKSKEHKRKTKVIKDTCNPVYDELFEYVISKEEVALRQIRISVISQKTSFMNRSSDMGQVTIDLKNEDLNNNKLWFDLEPEAD